MISYQMMHICGIKSSEMILDFLEHISPGDIFFCRGSVNSLSYVCFDTVMGLTDNNFYFVYRIVHYENDELFTTIRNLEIGYHSKWKKVNS